MSIDELLERLTELAQDANRPDHPRYKDEDGLVHLIVDLYALIDESTA